MQDLFGTFAYNTGLIPIVGRRFNPITESGVFSWLPLLTATITALSSLNVVSNAILIGTYKPEVALNMTVL